MSHSRKVRQEPPIAGWPFLALAYQFLPGWKDYFTSLTEEEKSALRQKYNFTKYNEK
ncbi:MAG: hypothetical protein MJZ67_08140 [Bacteroidales bacterium]|nr:hypothetical protein [Bacteroidales bacterium]